MYKSDLLKAVVPWSLWLLSCPRQEKGMTAELPPTLVDKLRTAADSAAPELIPGKKGGSQS